MQMECKGQGVLGLTSYYKEDTISLDLSAIAERAEGLPATKRNTLWLIAGIIDPLMIIGPVTITAKISFSGGMPPEDRLGRPSQRQGKTRSRDVDKRFDWMLANQD